MWDAITLDQCFDVIAMHHVQASPVRIVQTQKCPPLEEGGHSAMLA